MTSRGRSALATLVLASAPITGAADQTEWLYFAEANRLHRVAIDPETIDAPREARHEIVIPSAADDPARGRDVNGMICAVPGSSGWWVAGEDTGQPSPPAGWGLFDETGQQRGKLTPASAATQPEPFGCAFDTAGRLVTSEVGDPGFGTSNGALLLWYPPFDRFPGDASQYPETNATSDNYCVLADGIGTAGAIAIDERGRIHLASSSRMAIYRFSPPFPSSPTAADGCGRETPRGAPLADAVQMEVFVRAPATFSGLAFAPNGNLYAASVATGRIVEYDPEGRFVRSILNPSEWLPPFSTGYPQGLAVDSSGTLYYADLDLIWQGTMPGPGPNGSIRRVRFGPDGEPLPPEILLDGLAFPDAVSVIAASSTP